MSKLLIFIGTKIAKIQNRKPKIELLMIFIAVYAKDIISSFSFSIASYIIISSLLAFSLCLFPSIFQ